MCAKVSMTCIDPPGEGATASVYHGLPTQSMMLSVLSAVADFTVAIILKSGHTGCHYYFTNDEALHQKNHQRFPTSAAQFLITREPFKGSQGPSRTLAQLNRTPKDEFQASMFLKAPSVVPLRSQI